MSCGVVVTPSSAKKYQDDKSHSCKCPLPVASCGILPVIGLRHKDRGAVKTVLATSYRLFVKASRYLARNSGLPRTDGWTCGSAMATVGKKRRPGFSRPALRSEPGSESLHQHLIKRRRLHRWFGGRLRRRFRGRLYRSWFERLRCRRRPALYAHCSSGSQAALNFLSLIISHCGH